MKKFISILIIIIALIFTGMQNANAQATVYIYWAPEYCDECPSPGDWVWRVDIEVEDLCGEEGYTIYRDNQIIEPPADDATFVLGEFCDNQSLEECYMVVAALKKICPNGYGGYTIVCSGKNPGINKSCPWLMNSGNTLILPITFQ
ncbi:MAG: hypothetical protein M0Q51_11995 [Bacteroidales bacterium]|nr:hypothetical protein [Bacteroidales bacterium]